MRPGNDLFEQAKLVNGRKFLIKFCYFIFRLFVIIILSLGNILKTMACFEIENIVLN